MKADTFWNLMDTLYELCNNAEDDAWNLGAKMITEVRKTLEPGTVEYAWLEDWKRGELPPFSSTQPLPEYIVALLSDARNFCEDVEEFLLDDTDSARDGIALVERITAVIGGVEE